MNSRFALHLEVCLPHHPDRDIEPVLVDELLPGSVRVPLELAEDNLNRGASGIVESRVRSSAAGSRSMSRTLALPVSTCRSRWTAPFNSEAPQTASAAVVTASVGELGGLVCGSEGLLRETLFL